ncbi:hypothetical protein [Streptomyces violaceusniger]|uniref:Uncharacterized protein n=1 Tax=Streptomyces violaceusniger (strain Tu 4113) TaxID=653045 RepID=G2PHV1_STRV4|nr:hypothetical protein [Streptomyces violaceusniger]AEM88902.1 hypothetical protein Strvi_0126 [Streptomyces violaceusniger Tu 4113]
MTHRHHTPSDEERHRLRAAVTAAPLLELTEITGVAGGRVLPVMSVGILDEPHVPYVRLTSQALYRVPELLRPWAESFIRVHLNSENPPELPCWVEFGVSDGQAVAAMRGSTRILPAN